MEIDLESGAVARIRFHDNSGAEWRRGIGSGEIVKHGRNNLLASNGVFGVSAIDRDGGSHPVAAVNEIAAAVGITTEAMSAISADVVTLSEFPQRNVRTDGINSSEISCPGTRGCDSP